MDEEQKEKPADVMGRSLSPSEVPVPSTSTSLVPVPSFNMNSLRLLDVYKPHFEAIRKQCLDISPVYELHDFAGKIRSRWGTNRFKLSLPPIDEIIYQDICHRVTRSNQARHLCTAVLSNELNFVKKLIECGVPPNCFDDHKRTPLHLAVSKGHCEMVKLLISKGADPNIKDGLGNSCLHLAACTNNVEMALILIKGGASVNAVDIRGRSPVQLAQSKLRILQQSPNEYVKSKVTQIIDMLLLYLEKGSNSTEKNEEAELLSNFQTRLQITDTPEQISNEIDNLSKMLNQMQTLSLS